MTWTCNNGIRVESADEQLFSTMRKAGCYRVCLDSSLATMRSGELWEGWSRLDRAGPQCGQSRAGRGHGDERIFLLGLSPDTEETMAQTIAFARNIPTDIMKFGITIAFPGTPMFNDYMKKGLVRSFDWDDYFVYTDQNLFAHEHLSYETIRHYMRLAYKKCITRNPGFIWRRFVRGLRTGEFLWDIYYAIKIFFLPSVGEKSNIRYYARDRWPAWDYRANPLKPVSYEVVRKSKVVPQSPSFSEPIRRRRSLIRPTTSRTIAVGGRATSRMMTE